MRIASGRFIQSCLLGILSLHLSANILAESWIKAMPEKCLQDLDMPRVPYENIYEIPKSRTPWAVGDLEYDTFIALHSDKAKAYLGDWYRQPKGRTPYLLRAVYASSNGRFTLYWCGDDLVISHSALVSEKAVVKEHKTAVVADLERVPSNVYVNASPLDD